MRALFILLMWPVVVMGYPKTPDVDETPGSVCVTADDDFEEYRYPEQIIYCHRSVASSLKKEIYETYDIPESQRKNYTIDHLIPLSIGGDNHRENLWPEHKEVKALRPELEVQLYNQLKVGKILQRAAIDKILEAKFDPGMVRKRFEVRLRPLNLMEVVGLEIR